MKKEDFMSKMKKGPKKKEEMSSPEKKAIMKVLESMSEEAGRAMSGKLTIKADSKEEAQALVDKAEEAVDSLPEGEGAECGMEEEEEGKREYMDDDYEEEDMEEEYDESEGDYMKDGMDNFMSDDEDMPSDKFEEDDMRDFSGMSEEELDDEIEKLTKMRERMKIASMN